MWLLALSPMAEENKFELLRSRCTLTRLCDVFATLSPMEPHAVALAEPLAVAPAVVPNSPSQSDRGDNDGGLDSGSENESYEDEHSGISGSESDE
jgi:hypothetical protein